MVSKARVKTVAEYLRYSGIKARTCSKDNSIVVSGEKGYNIAKRDRGVLINKIKVKLKGIS